ncbi:hypothetical protein C8R43DRAFT_954749 [Mycena crocata]|nr:hypothetical protein C8R43DRAFT_954749 [Mycena crocata]
MHRALGILEIVELICEQVGTRKYWKELPIASRCGSRKLFALARTSTVFLNPALEAPGDIRDTELPTEDGYTQPRDLDIVRIPLQLALCKKSLIDDWKRALFYMSGFKSLCIRDHTFKSSEFFEALSFDMSQYSNLPPNSFPVLEKMSTVSATTERLILFLAQVSSCRLVELHLEHADTGFGPHVEASLGPPTGAMAAQFYSTLAKHIPHSSLRTLTRSSYDYHHPLVDATPDLQLLYAVDANANGFYTNRWEKESGPKEPSRPRRVVGVALSPIRQPISVAELLAEIFPALQEIETLHEDLGSMGMYLDGEDPSPDVLSGHELWKTVEDHLSY